MLLCSLSGVARVLADFDHDKEIGNEVGSAGGQMYGFLTAL